MGEMRNVSKSKVKQSDSAPCQSPDIIAAAGEKEEQEEEEEAAVRLDSNAGMGKKKTWRTPASKLARG